MLYPIGRGGFGTVYRADMLGDEGFRRPVALKVLNPNVAGIGEVARRFRDEARLLGLLRHRSIVQVDGLVEMGGRQVVVMEFIDGVDLAQLMELGPIPPGPALEIIGEVAGALDVAWRKTGADGRPLRLLHRDIKPANIRISTAGEVKVLDFGIARAEFSSREAATRSMLFGSEGYMAPERFDLEDGAPADIYSLGVVLLEAVTQRAFGRTSIRPEKLKTRTEDALAAAPSMPGPLADLIRAMMAYEPEDRPTAREVESQAWDLRARSGAKRLRDWAEPAVTRAASSQRMEPDELSDTILVERSGLKDLAEEEDAGEESSGTGMTLVPASSYAANSGGETIDFGYGSSFTSVPEAADEAAAADGRLPAAAPSIPPREEEPDTDELDRIVAPSAASPSHPPDAPAPGSRKTLFGAIVGFLLVAGSAGAWVFWPGSERDRPSPASVDASPAEPASVGATKGPVAAPTPPPADVAPTPDDPKVEVGPPDTPDLGVAGSEAAAKDPEPTPVADETKPPPNKATPVSPSPTPSPKREAPSTAAAPAQPTTGTVRIAGDASNVVLKGTDGRSRSAGAVPPGTYSVEADFGAGLVPAGQVEVVAGATVTVSCTTAFQRCQ